MSLIATPRDRALVLILALGAAIAFAVFPLFPGLIGAGVLYVIVARPFRRLAANIGSTPAVVIALVTAIVAVVLPAAVLVALVADQAPDALQSLQRSTFLERAHDLRIGSFALGAELAKVGAALASWLPAQLLRIAGSTASALLNLTIAFFGLYYLLRSDGATWAALRDYIPFSPGTVNELHGRFFAMTEAVLIGWVLVAIAQGSVVAAAFAMTGLPDPLFWGLITAVASILPVLGSGLVWTPAALILVLQGRYGAALIMGVAGVIAGSIDNVIRLFVYRRVSDIHPLITLVGAFAGVRFFGLLGLLVGPLAIAYLFELLRAYRLEYGAPRERHARAPAVGLARP